MSGFFYRAESVLSMISAGFSIETFMEPTGGNSNHNYKWVFFKSEDNV